MDKRFQIVTRSEKETKRVARALGEEVRRTAFPKKGGALVFALSGELGSGKTAFVQGALLGLGVKKKTSSPTFVIVKRFPVRGRGVKNVYHIDMYRIKSAHEVSTIGIEKILRERSAVVFIEWADKVRRKIPPRALWISFSYAGKKERKIVISKNDNSLVSC